MAETLSGMELRSTITSDAWLELALIRQEVASPEAGEVLVRIAAPINPADILVMFGPADPASFEFLERDGVPLVRARVPAEKLAGVAARLDQPLLVGNEGAGIVVQAGAGAEHLLGRSVALRDRMFAEYRTAKLTDCIVLPTGMSPHEGASASINPMTVLSMVDTMKREGHSALVHTAAASSLGQMLNRLCLTDGIPLVNIVRSDEQVALLRQAGAIHVVNSAWNDFPARLLDAIEQTDATLAFDAIGGGTMASDILHAMEIAQSRKSAQFSRYGSPVHKQVYVYGLLDPGDRVLRTNIGTAWSVGGWLMSWHLAKIGANATDALRARMLNELTTIFRTDYAAEIALADMLNPHEIARYGKPATGSKFLVVRGKHC
ncbi:NADH oxidase [Rhizobium sp. P38BS-XIX]|uniref:NADH oxidase n=1 Tax=Rhizobium sp. P38BS-XIX TaxID=2726740 RepID=UPI0014566717|nr:NADH oxidase [Rhizobium sp. P38BS-XIX]NLS01601.1 NADH oxidase [Rhizobium sp. P38BS-XIX]